MNWIWTIDSLERQTQSPHPRVRSWAIDRLGQQFPDRAGAILAPLLRDPSDEVAADAAGFFSDHPDLARADPTLADSLLALFERGTPSLLGPSARAMAQIGDFRFVPIALEKCVASASLDPAWHHLRRIVTLRETDGPGPAGAIAWLHNFLERTPPPTEKERQGKWQSHVMDAVRLLLLCKRQEEMVYLIRYLLDGPSLERCGYALLLPFVRLANPDYSEEEMEKTIEPALRKRVDGIPMTLPKGVTGRRGKEPRYVTWIRRFHEEAEEIYRKVEDTLGSDALRRWEEEERPPLICLRFLRALVLCSDRLERAPAVVQKRFAAVALVVQKAFLQDRIWIGRCLDEMTPADQLALLFDDHADREEDDRLLDRLARADSPAPLIQSALREIQECPEGWGAPRAVKLLGRLRAPEALPTLISIFLKDDDDFMLEAVDRALSGYGEALLPHIRAILEKGEEAAVRTAIFLLAELPCPETVSLILPRMEHLHRLNRDGLLYAIETIGAVEFLPFIQREMRVDEPEEKTYLHLCRLHGVDDPQLARIERVVSYNAQRAFEVLSRVFVDGEDIPIGNDLRLPLRCRDCGRTYTYRIERAWLDSDDEEMEHLNIVDEVTCKGCQGVNRYEMTHEARTIANLYLDRFFDLVDAGKATEDEGVVQVIRTMVAGRRMSSQQGLLHYQKEIGKAPDRPDLRVGYGNLLLHLKRVDEARAEFEKGVALDPFAIEALDALAQINADRGRPEEAYRLIQDGLARFHQGNFYRMGGETKEGLLARMEETGRTLEKELGLPVAAALPTRTISPTIHGPKVGGPKVGRNDPCPCGSGKKYKKCCLGKEATMRPPAPETMMGTAEQAWIRRILAYAWQPRFRWAMQAARVLFFGTPTGAPPSPSNDGNAQQGGFMDWFVHDYRAGEGVTIVEAFLREEKLSPTEREITRDALDAFISLYEVQAVHPDTATIETKDLVTGERLAVRDVAGARQLVKWDVLGARVFRVEGILRFSGVVHPLPRTALTEIVGYFTDRWKSYREEKPGASWKAFMKARGHLFHQYVRRMADTPPPPPNFVTSERHEVVFCKAIYDVNDFPGVLLRLKDAFDFHLQSEEPEEVQFDWLKRGDSTFLVPEAVPEAVGERKGVSVVETYFGRNKGPGRVVLGNCTVTERRLTLETRSEERLTAGKGRLEKILGACVRFRMDSLQSVEAALSEPREPSPKQAPPPGGEAVMREYLTRHYEKWLYDSIPALDGKTPMEMVALPGGRERVAELLKGIENDQEKQRRDGHPVIDIGWIWEKLGFSRGQI